MTKASLFDVQHGLHPVEFAPTPVRSRTVVMRTRDGGWSNRPRKHCANT